ncbi:hypothetical protein CORC01_02544, partial [Colletotrichum orchidophilum]
AHKISSEPCEQSPWGKQRPCGGGGGGAPPPPPPRQETNVLPHWMDKCKQHLIHFNPNPDPLGQFLAKSKPPQPPPPRLLERMSPMPHLTHSDLLQPGILADALPSPAVPP